MDCSPPGSSVLGILQARILKWVFLGGFTDTMNMQSAALTCSPVFKKKAHLHLSNGLDFFKGKDIDKDTQARIAA